MCLSSAHRNLCIRGYKDRGYAQCTRGLCSCSVRGTSCPPTQTASPTYTSAPAPCFLELLLCRI
ncbi:lymphotoxin A [Rattus norvegicus]|uniref:Lymphotoxin A n=1 Tax=Rattus norvegicus TaxID=10116 RepID=A6KTW9_RAT|nr:lymphotoxin A [Rattus norvegicus]